MCTPILLDVDRTLEQPPGCKIINDLENRFSPSALNRGVPLFSLMRTEAVQKLVGRPVKDTFGRYAGYVVGFSVDMSGDLQFVGIDQGNGEFTEFPGRRILVDRDGLVVIPAWKVEAENLKREIDTVRKRVQALEGLVKDGEITHTMYQQMVDQYNQQLKSFQESHSALLQNLSTRLDDIEGRSESLDRFLANVKVQFRAGELDEGTFKVASEYSTSMRTKNGKEIEEIQSLLRSLSQPAAQSIAQTATKKDTVVAQATSG